MTRSESGTPECCTLRTTLRTNRESAIWTFASLSKETSLDIPRSRVSLGNMPRSAVEDPAEESVHFLFCFLICDAKVRHSDRVDFHSLWSALKKSMGRRFSISLVGPTPPGDDRYRKSGLYRERGEEGEGRREEEAEGRGEGEGEEREEEVDDEREDEAEREGRDAVSEKISSQSNRSGKVEEAKGLMSTNQTRRRRSI